MIFTPDDYIAYDLPAISIGKKKENSVDEISNGTLSRTRSREEFRCCCLHGTRESGEHVVIVFRCKAVLERAFVSSTDWLCDHRDTRARYTWCLSKIRIHFARLILPYARPALSLTT